MKSRRSFIAKTTMATTALFATKPFNALAGLSNSFIGYSSKNNHLVFLHVADTELAFSGKTGSYINTVRSKAANSILLHTGKECKSGKFDVQVIADDYQIIQKAGIKTGIIHIAADEINAIDKVNRQARQLKKDENCQMVICISHLHHKSKSGSDNLKLAAMSEHLDMIIGADTSLLSPKTMVLANKHKSEVLLQYSKHNELNCGKIEFAFDGKGEKRHIHFATKLYQHSVA